MVKRDGLTCRKNFRHHNHELPEIQGSFDDKSQNESEYFQLFSTTLNKIKYFDKLAVSSKNIKT